MTLKARCCFLGSAVLWSCRPHCSLRSPDVDRRELAVPPACDRRSTLPQRAHEPPALIRSQLPWEMRCPRALPRDVVGWLLLWPGPSDPSSTPGSLASRASLLSPSAVLASVFHSRWDSTSAKLLEAIALVYPSLCCLIPCLSVGSCVK